MNIEKKNLDEARKLLKELDVLEDVSDVCSNYDSKAYAVYTTVHNNNTKVPKEVRVQMPIEVVLAMKNYISHRIDEIKENLESM